MTRVKICGLSTPEAVAAAVAAGADLVGFVLSSPSRRQVTLEQARALIEPLALLEHGPLCVGVFVNETAEFINHAAQFCGLDMAQLSGDEPPSLCNRLGVPVIKAIHVRGPESLALAGQYGVERILLDTAASGEYGGSGRAFDWTWLDEFIGKRNVMLAGGLTPDNVIDALVRVRPWGVDVSSGVEVDGRKDAGRIAAFVRAVRAWDAG